MDSLASHIVTIIGTIVAAQLVRLIEPKVKIVYWLSSDFMYQIPTNQLAQAAAGVQPNPAPAALPPAGGEPMPQQAGQATHFLLRTSSLTIQNLGRKAADWVEIAHRRKPDFFQLQPPLNYSESTGPSGEHVLRVQSLASKELVTIQVLSYINPPDLAYIRSPVGHAPAIPVMPVRRYPQWFYRLVNLTILIGVGSILYWLIRAGMFTLKRLLQM